MSDVFCQPSKYNMTNIACASLEVLLGALLLHDADMNEGMVVGNAKHPWSSSPMDDTIFHLRQICAAVCFAAAAIRTAMPPAARRLVEEVAMFISFAVAMVTRAAAGCAAEEQRFNTDPRRQCCPVAIAAMLATLLCSACVWGMCMNTDQRKVDQNQRGRSLI